MSKIKLPRKHLDAIIASRQQLAHIAHEIPRAEAAGIDVSQHKEMHAMLTDKLNKMMQQYGEVPK